MTSKEKAKELYDKYYERTESPRNARWCALIAADLIIGEWNNEGGRKAKQKYWKEVKEELENL